MTDKIPPATQGLRHVALFVENFEACLHFYKDLLRMQVDWHPDENNIYLTSGYDNLALHRTTSTFQPSEHQRLDHIGFMLKNEEDVDTWYTYLQTAQVAMKTQPRTHRDGSRSFYCLDPDGNTVQMLHFPNLKV